MPNRQQLRKMLRQQRQGLSFAERQRLATLIHQKVMTLPAFKQNQHIAFYVADDGEVDPITILLAAETLQKQCYLPVLHLPENRYLEFYAYRSQDWLQKNRFGIGEPDITKERHVATEDLDCVFLPLVGFDEKGNRLGRGVGYYDRTLAFLLNSSHQKPILIGLAYEFQKIDHFTPASWDVPLDMVVTEKNIYRTQRP